MRQTKNNCVNRRLRRDILIAFLMLAMWTVLNFWLIWWREAHGIAQIVILAITGASTLVCIRVFANSYRAIRNYMSWHDDILDCLEIPVIVMDLDFHIILLNKAAGKLIPAGSWGSIMNVRFVEGELDKDHKVVECGDNRYSMHTSRLMDMDREHIGYVKMLQPCGLPMGRNSKELLALQRKLMDESVISIDNI